MSTTRQPPVKVSETPYSGSAHGPVVDAGVQGGDNSVYAETFESSLGHHGASEVLPGLRNSLRSVDDVERDREPDRRAGGGWTRAVLVGVGVFFVILAASPVVVWVALNGVSRPAAAPAPEQQDELMGIPVRRGLK